MAAVKFDKYDRYGAIHWLTTRRFGLIFNAPLVSRYRSVIRRIPEGKIRILDIGCGDGYLACKIAAKRPDSQVIGIESELKGVLIARQFAAMDSLSNVIFDQNEKEGLPFEESSFDVVVMTDVIEHLPDPVAMLQEIRRVLAPGGTAIITTPNRQDGSKWDVRHDHEYTTEELKSEIEKYLGPTEVFGSWPMRHVRSWRRKRIGRAFLDLSARIGLNFFDEEKVNPGNEYGQLTAVTQRGRRIQALSRQ